MNRLLQILERLHLRTQLLLGALSGMVVALLIGAHGLNSVSVMEGQIERLYAQELLALTHTKEANLNLIYMSRNMRQMLIAQDDRTRAEARTQVVRARERLLLELAEARERLARPEAVERFQAFERDLDRFLEAIDYAVSLIERDRERERYAGSAAAAFVTSPEFMMTVNRADNGLHDLAEFTQRSSEEALHAARDIARRTQTTALVLLVLGMLGALAAGALIGATIQRPHDRLRRSVEDLAGGRVDAHIPHTDYPNEVGALARAMHVLQDIYRRSNDQHWVKSSAAELTALLQQSTDHVGLAQRAVSHLTPLVGGAHGAFYVATDEGQAFRLLGTYGLQERQQLGNTFRLGEGLVGQCAMERSAILLTTPGHYVRITSGLGQADAGMVMVVPLMHRDRVLGVLEVASLGSLGERSRALLEAAAEVLGTNLEIMDRHVRTQQLLSSTQAQAEQVQQQALKLESQTLILENQQAELKAVEAWYRDVLQASPDGLLVVDEWGQIILANGKAEQLLGYGAGELMGTDVEQLVPMVGHAPRREAAMTADDGTWSALRHDRQVPARHRDGHTVPLVLNLQILPLHPVKGRCVSVGMRPVLPHD